MNRLPPEFERLYAGEAPAAAAAPGATASAARALVFELRRPSDWSVLSRVWRGVQAELGLPAPAIAVSGRGLQLWFSLQAPVAPARAHAFLAALERRWLADVTPRQLDFHIHSLDRAVPRVPAALGDDDQWSAFVAPDLAGMFDSTPWLDVEPGDDGQAALLRGLSPITSAEFEAAERQMDEDAAPVSPAVPLPVAAAAASASVASAPAGSAASAADAATATADMAAAAPTAAPSVDPKQAATTDPRQFLLAVMNDPDIALALRIEAAKALLPYAGA